MRVICGGLGRFLAFGLLFVLGSPLVAIAPAASAPAAVRSVNTLSTDERAKLPDTTIVSVKSGTLVSLGALRRQHVARLARFKAAAGRGHAVNVSLTSRMVVTHFIATGPSARFNIGAVAGAHRIDTVPQTATTKSAAHVTFGQVAGGQGQIGSFGSTAPPGSAVTVAAIQMQGWGTVGFAKDFQDFCYNAMASACLYLPPNTTFFFDAHDFGENPIVAANYVMDNDPLILDSDLCKSEGGWEWPNGFGCVYKYPVNYFANFFPGNHPLALAGNCGAPASYGIDPKGAVRVNYTPPASILSPNSYFAEGKQFSTGANPITCVVQIWTTTS